MREGDAVLVSGAAGAVGSVAGQLARLLGAAQGGRLRRLGREGRLADRRARVRRRRQLQGRPRRPAAQARTRRSTSTSTTSAATTSRPRSSTSTTSAGSRRAARSRSTTTRARSPGPRNMMMIVSKRLTLRGFIVTDHADAGRRVLPARRRLGGRGQAAPPARPSSTGSTTRSTRSSTCCAAATPARCWSGSEVTPRQGRHRHWGGRSNQRRCSKSALTLPGWPGQVRPRGGGQQRGAVAQVLGEQRLAPGRRRWGARHRDPPAGVRHVVQAQRRRPPAPSRWRQQAGGGVEAVVAEQPPAVAGDQAHRLDEVVGDGVGDEVVEVDPHPARLDALAAAGDLALELVGALEVDAEQPVAVRARARAAAAGLDAEQVVEQRDDVVVVQVAPGRRAHHEGDDREPLGASRLPSSSSPGSSRQAATARREAAAPPARGSWRCRRPP